MSNTEEWLPIISKLLRKTEERKLDWEPEQDGFRCTVRDIADSFDFFLSTAGTGLSRTIFINMTDPQGRSIISANSTALPTSPEEETMSDALESLYELARRQVLKVDERIKLVSDLLDRA
jgi:hypothetical protein